MDENAKRRATREALRSISSQPSAAKNEEGLLRYLRMSALQEWRQGRTTRRTAGPDAPEQAEPGRRGRGT